MREKISFIQWLAGGMVLCACTFSLSLVPEKSPTPVPLSITQTRTATTTASPTSEPPTPTMTRTKTAATPATLDPAAGPNGAIAFERGTYNEDGVYLVTPKISGRGTLDFLYGQVSDPTWSPDGKQIALRLYKWREVSETESYWVDDIAVINRNGSGFKKLTRMPEGDRLWEFSWSPDGNWIAVVRSKMSPNYTYFDYAVWVLKTDGSGTMKKIGDTVNIESHVEWFQDSRRLAYLDPGGLLVIASIETGETETMDLISAPGDSFRLFDVSADGAAIVYLNYSDSEYSIRRADLAGWSSGEEPRVETLFTGVIDKDVVVIIPMVGDLALSPDGGRMIFFLTEPGKATLQLFAIGSDAPVTVAELTDYSPALARLNPGDRLVPTAPNWRLGWSADGQWILYATAVSGQGWENGNIYIVNADQALAGTIEPILVAEHGRNPDWQPVV